MDRARAAGDRSAVLPALFGLLWRRAFLADLASEPRVKHDGHVQAGGALRAGATVFLLARGAGPLRPCNGVPVPDGGAGPARGVGGAG